MSRPAVLVVDDEPLIRGYLKLALEGLPIDLTLVAGLAEAQERLRAGRWDLLVTDVTLGDGDGLELVALAARRTPALPVIVLSADASAPTRARAEALGAWRLLLKPVSVAGLLAALREALSLAAPEAPADERPPLIDEFRASCAARFPQDVKDGDRAISGDRARLGILAHNLKSVLAILGEAEASATATRLDASIGSGVGDPDALWRELRARLVALARQGAAAGDVRPACS